MLNWKTANGAWFANGFRIQRSSTNDWALYETGVEAESAVTIEPIPLASLPTLTACKYKAEEIHRREALVAARQRLGAVGVLSAAILVLSPVNPLVVMAMIVVGAAASLELVMTWFEDLVGGAREVVQ